MVNKKNKKETREMVAISNVAIVGKQAMTVRELKLLRLLLSTINQDDTSFKPITLSDKYIAERLNLSFKGNKAIGAELKEVGEKLFKRYLEVRDDSGNWGLYHWIKSVTHRDGELIITLNEEIKPFFIALKNRFTLYELNCILPMKSTYSIRIYEFLKSLYEFSYKKKKSFNESIAKLREVTTTVDKYDKISQFKARVIEPACAEINELTDLTVTYTFCKTGRSITSVEFFIEEKKGRVEEENIIFIPELKSEIGEDEDEYREVLVGRDMSDEDRALFWKRFTDRNSSNNL